ncbi:MAG: carbamoyltransferase [Planctomycetota bacterium]|nr:MAG: carbamoyltransferase [Planctomycetota bacterium]
MATVLGLNCFHADAAAALVRDGRLVAAVEEERFNRIKHSAGFPWSALRYCLQQGGLDLRELDAIAVGMKPIEHVQDEVLHILSGRPNYSRQIQKRLDAVARFRDLRALLARELGIPRAEVPRLEEVPHHVAHVASAYHLSGWEDAALLSVDGFGDFCSTLLARGAGGEVEPLEAVRFPHSLGILYTAVTQFLGFPRYGDEGKVMGLAAHGEPVYRDRLRQIVRLREGDLFELDPSYFTHPVYGVDMIWEDRVPYVEDIFSERLIEVFGPPRHRYAEVGVRDRDLAASLQAVLEEALLHLLRRLRELLPDARRLCYAGGVALNCAANRVLRAAGLFPEVFVPPAPGDAGTAVGAALVAARRAAPESPWPRPQLRSAQLGPGYSAEAIERALEGSGLRFARCERVAEEVADLLCDGKVVGWFQGRLEFGPRALGGRSILADPRRAEMREVLNSRIKYREPFRPFAASVLSEHFGEFFESAWESPFMAYAQPVRPERREEIPAVVHADGTCRVQTVEEASCPRFHALLSAFHARSGVPLLLNTSFNENEPIVCTPEDALDCFAASKMDALALEDYLILR